MKPTSRMACVLAAVLLSAATAARDREMAISLDDLPAVRSHLGSMERVATGLLSHLGAFEAPAVGFVNEVKLLEPGEIDRVPEAPGFIWDLAKKP